MCVSCPACGAEMPQTELNAHMACCRMAAQRFGGGGGYGGTRSDSRMQRPAATSSRQKQRAPPTLAIQPPEADGRVPCARCGRKFAPDRIAQHQYICAGLKRGPAQAPKTVAALVNPAATAMSSGRARESAAGRRPQMNCASQWREESNAFREAIRAARGQPAARSYPSTAHAGRADSSGRSGASGYSGGGGYGGSAGYSSGPGYAAGGAYGGGARGADRFEPCPHCGRTFAPAAWERHVDKCAHIVNKPAAPPGASMRRVQLSNGSSMCRTPLEASREASLAAMTRERSLPHGSTSGGGMGRRSGGVAFARSAGRDGFVPNNPETRAARPPSGSATLRNGSSRFSGGGMGGGGMGTGLGGGGGIDPSNRTSADNPLASMVSYQGAYRTHRR